MQVNRYNLPRRLLASLSLITLSLMLVGDQNPPSPPRRTRPVAQPSVKKALPTAPPLTKQKTVPPAKKAEPPKKTEPFLGIKVNNKKKKITLGTTAPLSSSLYKLGKDYTKGMGLVFNQVNRKGGVHGYRIKLHIRDDQYEQHQIKANIHSLLSKTSLLFGTFSSDVLYALNPEQHEKNLVIFPNAGASKFRTPKYSNCFFFRPSTAEEVSALISFATDVLFKRKIAVFYEDSYWGKDGMKAAKKILKQLKHKDVECVALASHVRNTVNVKEAVKKISKKSPEAVICITHYRPIYSFIKKMLNKGNPKTSFLGVSETSLLQEYLHKSRGINLISTSVVPSPWTSKLEIAKEYRKSMNKYLSNLKYSTISFEGFISASLFIASLQKTSPPITKEKIIKSLQGWTSESFKGIKASFNPQTRSLSKSLWINEGKDREGEHFTWKLFCKHYLEDKTKEANTRKGKIG